MNTHTKILPIIVSGITLLLFGTTLFLYSTNTPAQTVNHPNFTVDNLNLVGKKRVSRTDYEYTYTADLTNTGPDVTGTTATVTSSSATTTIVEGGLDFGDVATGTTATSTDTFTIRQDRRAAFDPDALTFDVNATNVPASTTKVVADGIFVPDYLEGAQMTDSNGNIISAYIQKGLGDYTDIQITEGVGPPLPVEIGTMITNGYIQIDYQNGKWIDGNIIQIDVEYSTLPDMVMIWDFTEGYWVITPFSTQRPGFITIREEQTNSSFKFGIMSKNY